MLRRSARRLYAPWGPTLRTSPETTKKVKQPQPIHLYSTKENAWANLANTERNVTHLKHTMRGMLRDHGFKYYLFGICFAVFFGGIFLVYTENEQVRQDGLAGAKKRRFRSRLTVVLDVDETIVSYGDKAFRLQASVVPRPYLAELLDFLTEIDAEVILWSACSDRYMKQVLSTIDPNGIRVSSFICRDRRWFRDEMYYEKNVFWLKRDPNSTLMVENRALSARHCNGNTILVDDFIRGEYMATGQDHPKNDRALKDLIEIIRDLNNSDVPVHDYLQDVAKRSKAIKEIPCHLAIRQLPDELARGVFYFLGDKFHGEVS